MGWCDVNGTAREQNTHQLGTLANWTRCQWYIRGSSCLLCSTHHAIIVLSESMMAVVPTSSTCLSVSIRLSQECQERLYSLTVSAKWQHHVSQKPTQIVCASKPFRLDSSHSYTSPMRLAYRVELNHYRQRFGTVSFLAYCLSFSGFTSADGFWHSSD